MSAAAVRLADVDAVAAVLKACVAEWPPLPTAAGPARLLVSQRVARGMALALLVEPPPGVRVAFRHALRPDGRVFRDGPRWWVFACRVCGHTECASDWREVMGLGHAHRLECVVAAVAQPPVLEGECGG